MRDIEWYKDRKKTSGDSLDYATDRMDLLIISISGGGIYVCLMTIQYLALHCICHSNYIKTAGIFFLFAIISNFISQKFSEIAHKLEYSFCDDYIAIDANDAKPTPKQETELDKTEKKSDKYGKYTNITNIISIICMAVGLFIMMGYFCFIF